jgi:hypothetical protein
VLDTDRLWMETVARSMSLIWRTARRMPVAVLILALPLLPVPWSALVSGCCSPLQAEGMASGMRRQVSALFRVGCRLALRLKETSAPSFSGVWLEGATMFWIRSIGY